MSQKTKMKKAVVTVVGVKNRCRKRDSHSFNLPELPEENFNQEEAEKEAITTVLKNMKTIERVLFSVHPFDMEDIGEGVIVRRYTIALGMNTRKDITERVKAGAK